MGKLKPFDQKRTKWQGLWYHPESYSYTSATLNLADIKSFKGNVRIIVKKNKFYEKDSNKPNYVFMLVDSDSEKYSLWEVEDDEDNEDRPYREEGNFYTGEGKRLYTEKEAQRAINMAVCDAVGHDGYYGEFLVSDYVR